MLVAVVVVAVVDVDVPVVDVRRGLVVVVVVVIVRPGHDTTRWKAMTAAQWRRGAGRGNVEGAGGRCRGRGRREVNSPDGRGRRCDSRWAGGQLSTLDVWPPKIVWRCPSVRWARSLSEFSGPKRRPAAAHLLAVPRSPFLDAPPLLYNNTTAWAMLRFATFERRTGRDESRSHALWLACHAEYSDTMVLVNS
ncbi:hypothetical protein PCL_05346 [Purpureocillium lilacinum]|uniref:Uncharacterized protein n=1 Tax=Purpureocillium lilacinum TaxID=33203 RepID=A0A2U3DV53_PURLI|nr:hypothetical protein PCL_05346 [Purpureocillium lilacinum]